jgi:hypothetical protein
MNNTTLLPLGHISIKVTFFYGFFLFSFWLDSNLFRLENIQIWKTFKFEFFFWI